MSKNPKTCAILLNVFKHLSTKIVHSNTPASDYMYQDLWFPISHPK